MSYIYCSNFSTFLLCNSYTFFFILIYSNSVLFTVSSITCNWWGKIKSNMIQQWNHLIKCCPMIWRMITKMRSLSAKTRPMGRKMRAMQPTSLYFVSVLLIQSLPLFSLIFLNWNVIHIHFKKHCKFFWGTCCFDLKLNKFNCSINLFEKEK